MIVNLTYVNLTYVKRTYVNRTYVNLIYVNLTYVNLTYVNLKYWCIQFSMAKTVEVLKLDLKIDIELVFQRLRDESSQANRDEKENFVVGVHQKKFT